MIDTTDQALRVTHNVYDVGGRLTSVTTAYGTTDASQTSYTCRATTTPWTIVPTWYVRSESILSMRCAGLRPQRPQAISARATRINKRKSGLKAHSPIGPVPRYAVLTFFPLLLYFNQR